MIRYDKARQRVYVAGLRIHHGAVGFVVTVIGALLMVHDWKDRPWTRDNA